MPPYAAPHRAAPPAPGHHLAGQAQCTAAAVILALVLRRLDRLDCAVAPGAPLDRALCAGRAVLGGSLSLSVNAGVVLVAGLLLVAAAAALLLRLTRKAPVYIVDFAVHKPDASWRFRRADVRHLAERNGTVAPGDIDFMEKLAFRSGLGDATAVTPAIQHAGQRKPGIEAARQEYMDTCFACVSELLEKTGVAPAKVKFVITNSSLFNPTPSLSAAIMNRFRMRDDTINYSLGGMGCSAGVVALDLARELLQQHPGSYALVVSHENITNNYYLGKDRGMMVPNVLFRSNGAAVLLSSRPADATTAKYTIRHIVRTIMAADDEAYRCVWQTEDAEGESGVDLKKELIGVAARALTRNMGRLGPLVLPASEQLKYAANAAARKLAKSLPPGAAANLPASWTKPYTPNFSKAFDAVCIHTGGRGVIDSMEQNLGMSKEMVEASRAALFQFGNTSSCSVWYELAYNETFGGLRRGARVWQLAFGSGFKCNSAVLTANRNVKDLHPAWDGFDKAKMYQLLDEVDREVAASRARRAAEKAKAEAEAAKAAAPAAASTSAAC